MRREMPGTEADMVRVPVILPRVARDRAAAPAETQDAVQFARHLLTPLRRRRSPRRAADRHPRAAMR